MIARRRFFTGSLALSVTMALPSLTFGQDDDARPDFEIAGSRRTNPPGHEVAWSNDWAETDITNLTFENIPGQLEYLVLDWEHPPSSRDHQRIVIEAHAASEVVDPEWLVDTFAENYPAAELGYAPGTRIETRRATDKGSWFSFAGGESPFETGTIGLALFYTPQQAGDALLRVFFNIHTGTNRTPEHLEMIDSTISINGDWLLGMDELGAYWEALESSTESTL